MCLAADTSFWWNLLNNTVPRRAQLSRPVRGSEDPGLGPGDGLWEEGLELETEFSPTTKSQELGSPGGDLKEYKAQA